MDFFKKNNTSRYPTDILIGELFVKAGIITQKQLDDTVRSAGAKHLHIGQMLVMSGFIKHQDLQAAVDTQSFVRDKVVDMAMAGRVLRLAVKTGASVFDLIKDEQAQGQASTQTNRLGELLMEAGLINRGQLSAAMQRSMSTGLPLGRILVLNNSIVDSLLRFALELQVRVRDEMIDRAEAIESLRAEATKLGMKVGYYDVNPNDSSINLKPLKQKVVRLGELLVSAQFLNETDVMSCLELGLLTERPIGEVMVEQGYISPEMLHVALTVQQMVEERVYTKEEAGQALMDIRDTNQISQLIEERLDGRYKTGSYTVLRDTLPASMQPGEIYDEPGFEQQQAQQQSEVIVMGTAKRADYDVSADLKEFDAVVGTAKTGRHSSARQQPSAPVTPAMTASNFEEAPSLESLMASVGGGETEEGPSLESLMAAVSGGDGDDVADSDFAADNSEFTQDGHGNGNGSASMVASSVAPALTGARDDDNAPDMPAAAAVAPPPPSPPPVPAHPFEALLCEANVVSVADIEHAFKQTRKNPLLLVEVLQQTGFLTTVGRTAALDCFKQMSIGQFDQEQAAQILDHCINKGRLRNLNLQDALIELGLAEGAEAAPAEVPESKAAQAKSAPPPPGTAPAADPVASVDTFTSVAAVVDEVAPAEAVAPAKEVKAAEEMPAVKAEKAAVEMAQAKAEKAAEEMAQAKAEKAAVEMAQAKAEKAAEEMAQAKAEKAAEEVAPPKAEKLMEAATVEEETKAPEVGAAAEDTVVAAEIDSLLAALTPLEPAENPFMAEVKDAEPEEQDSSLLKLFGLNEDGSSISEQAVVNSAQTASTAESLMDSLLPPTDVAAAMEEAATARPEAFQTTAVFKTIADEELDRASSMVSDDGGSLDSLLQRLEGNLLDGDEPELTDFGGESLTQPQPAVEPTRAASDEAKGIAREETISDQLLGMLDNLESNGNGSEDAAHEFSKKHTDEVDLRSLFSSLTVDSARKSGVGDPVPAGVAPKAAEKPATLEEPPAPITSPTTPSAAPLATPVAAASAPDLVTAQVVEAAPANAPTAPTSALSAADATQAAPPAVAAAPATTPAAAAPAQSAAPAAKAKSSASMSNSKLVTMTEAEILAAKTAQISAMATALTKLAEMHYETANYAEAQKAYERILSWRQGELGDHHVDLVDDLNNLAGVMCVQELFDQAEPMIRRAVEILEKAEKPEPLKLAENLTSLAGLQFRLGVFEKAEPLLARSLILREQVLGPDNTDLADALRDYAKLLKKLGKLEDAERHYSRAKVLIARRKAEEEG